MPLKFRNVLDYLISVIEQARNHISTDTNKIENMIAKLEESQKNAERD